MYAGLKTSVATGHFRLSKSDSAEIRPLRIEGRTKSLFVRYTRLSRLPKHALEPR
jgi:hypothetical protein